MIALVALICITVLRAFDKIDQASFNGLAGLITGYAVGNGMGAAKRQDTRGIFGPKEND